MEDGMLGNERVSDCMSSFSPAYPIPLFPSLPPSLSPDLLPSLPSLPPPSLPPSLPPYLPLTHDQFQGWPGILCSHSSSSPRTDRLRQPQEGPYSHTPILSYTFNLIHPNSHTPILSYTHAPIHLCTYVLYVLQTVLLLCMCRVMISTTSTMLLRWQRSTWTSPRCWTPRVCVCVRVRVLSFSTSRAAFNCYSPHLPLSFSLPPPALPLSHYCMQYSVH